MKLLQIGCGMVGRVIAEELAGDFEVTAMDGRAANLELLQSRVPQVRVCEGSVKDRELLEKMIGEADLVSLALPGNMAVEPARAAIRSGKPVCDISSIPNEVLFGEFASLTEEYGTTYLPKVGIAPGMTNFLVGRGASQMDQVEDVKIYVGGVPDRRIPPLDYKAVFCLEEVLQEYLDPATIIRDGKEVVVEALSDLHPIEFEGVGQMEAFVTDGLATLSRTIPARNMAEYTVRWPGHAEKIGTLISLGLFDSARKQFGEVEFAPIEYLTRLLEPQWKMDPAKGDRDLTVLKITVRGLREGRESEFSWELVDRYDEEHGITSMGKCTGFACATFARAFRKGLISGKGVVGPEKVAASDELYHFVMRELALRGVVFKEHCASSRVFSSRA